MQDQPTDRSMEEGARGQGVMLEELVHIQMPQKLHTQVTWTAFENCPMIGLCHSYVNNSGKTRMKKEECILQVLVSQGGSPQILFKSVFPNDTGIGCLRSKRQQQDPHSPAQALSSSWGPTAHSHPWLSGFLPSMGQLSIWSHSFSLSITY